MKKWLLAGIGAALLFTQGFATAAVETPADRMSDETKECVSCHKKNTPGLVQMWGASKHYGANVGCYQCHAADPEDPDAFIHDGRNIKVTEARLNFPCSLAFKAYPLLSHLLM